VPSRKRAGRRERKALAAPDRGDLVWVEFEPHPGHEQAGRRPALVLTPRNFNEQLGLMWACPITGKIKGYPFEVRLPAGGPIQGAVLVDQLRVMDWHARNVKVERQAPPEVTAEALGKARAILA
jgi:mRNA interferase MazF